MSNKVQDKNTKIQLVEIFILLYNKKDFIARTIESCINQTFDKNCYKIIILDDQSNDGSYNIALDYQKKYPRLIEIIRHKSNIGFGQNVEYALTHLKGEYFHILDGDDTLQNNFLEIMYNESQSYNKEIDLVRCSNRLIDFDDKEIGFEKISKPLFSYSRLQGALIRSKLIEENDISFLYYTKESDLDPFCLYYDINIYAKNQSRLPNYQGCNYRIGVNANNESKQSREYTLERCLRDISMWPKFYQKHQNSISCYLTIRSITTETCHFLQMGKSKLNKKDIYKTFQFANSLLRENFSFRQRFFSLKLILFPGTKSKYDAFLLSLYYNIIWRFKFRFLFYIVTKYFSIF